MMGRQWVHWIDIAVSGLERGVCVWILGAGVFGILQLSISRE